jgi:hypothetical protein
VRNGKGSAGSLPVRPGGVAAALEESLPAAAGRVSGVRVELARRLARQIDDEETAGYVLPKLSAELRAVLVELEGGRADGDPEQAARRILRSLAEA